MGNPLARSGFTVACLTFGLAAAALAACAPAEAADAPDIFGTFWATRYDAKIQIVGGGELPLTPEGKAAYQMNIAGLKDGSITDAARRWCVPDGVPRVLATPYPFEIINAPRGQVTIVYELNHEVRVVAMDKPLPSDKELIPYPYYNGHSVGHHEGDTLVIETAGFNEKTFIDSTGAPHTDENAHDRTDPPDRPDRDRGRHHHPRSAILHARLAGALRLSATRRRAAAGLRLRRAASRHILGCRRAPSLRIRNRARSPPAGACGACP